MKLTLDNIKIHVCEPQESVYKDMWYKDPTTFSYCHCFDEPAMLSIGWLLVYDIVTIVLSAYDFIDLLDLSTGFILQEIFTLLGFSFLFVIYKDLRKADNPEKYKESTDWFYESLDKSKDEGENKNV